MKFDLVIGVDFGMSGTAVAYHRPRGSLGLTKSEEVACLLWGSDRTIEKVPTKLAYKQDGHRRELIGWGTDIPVDNKAILIQEWFKTEFGKPGADQTEVERLFLDYLSGLHAEMSSRFTRDVLHGKPWAESHISFYFSTPSTWDTALVGRFKGWVEAAGFGQAKNAVHGRGIRTVDVSLVEPQATAALHLCSQGAQVRFKNGQCVMVVDAGAGTGDFSLLKIRGDEQGTSRLDEKSPVHGGKIGAAYIDQELQTRIAEILKPYSSHLSCDVGTAAWIMRCSDRFQQAKHQFGTDQPQEGIPVPHLKHPESSLGDRIQNGMLVDIQNDLEDAFNEQLDKIQMGILDVIDNWHTDGRQNYLLLSGGLGSSAYVQKKLRDFCARHDALKDTHVVVSHCPRMAVSMGLVYDAMSNRTLLAEICCRTSFGLVFRKLKWNPLTSRVKSKLRGFTPWILSLVDSSGDSRVDSRGNSVYWFIKQGDRHVNGGEVTHLYEASFKTDAPRVCDIEIVPSTNRSLSPSEKDHPQSRVLMRVDLEHSEPLGAFTTWRQQPYVTVPFRVKATIEPAEVKFRCVDSKKKEVSERVRFFADGGHSIEPLLMGVGEDEE